MKAKKPAKKKAKKAGRKSVKKSPAHKRALKEPEERKKAGTGSTGIRAARRRR